MKKTMWILLGLCLIFPAVLQADTVTDKVNSILENTVQQVQLTEDDKVILRAVNQIKERLENRINKPVSRLHKNEKKTVSSQDIVRWMYNDIYKVREQEENRRFALDYAFAAVFNFKPILLEGTIHYTFYSEQIDQHKEDMPKQKIKTEIAKLRYEFVKQVLMSDEEFEAYWHDKINP